jgi:hypothetical protein
MITKAWDASASFFYDFYDSWFDMLGRIFSEDEDQVEVVETDHELLTLLWGTWYELRSLFPAATSLYQAEKAFTDTCEGLLGGTLVRFRQPPEEGPTVLLTGTIIDGDTLYAVGTFDPPLSSGEADFRHPLWTGPLRWNSEERF